MIRRAINGVAVWVIRVLRRLDPYYRDLFDRLLQRRIVAVVQFLKRRLYRDPGLGVAEEMELPNEAEVARQIVEQMSAFMRAHYQGKVAERAGNTKTYGLVRGSFEVLPGLPAELRVGLFAESRTFPAWVRFAGPGPLATRDIDNNGILSLGVKVMGVPGPKLMADESLTQDFSGISCPTFTTPNVVENLKLQKEILRDTPVWYFLNPTDSHLLDALMQGLYARTHANPLELRYFSCVPYLFGEKRAIKYAFTPRVAHRSRVPRSLAADYLREAMVGTLTAHEVVFDFCVQFQTDPRRMPIEDAGVEWSEKLSPFVPVAVLRLPSQQFDTPAQLAYARCLSLNPWHCLPEHRPLGNQNRARKHIYETLSNLRQRMNREEHVEPTGQEQFPVETADSRTSADLPR